MRARGEQGEEFILGGELYKLEMRGGKKVPVKVPAKTFTAKSFKGKCFNCPFYFCNCKENVKELVNLDLRQPVDSTVTNY